MAVLCYDEAFLYHDSGPGHPESERRLLAIEGHLKRQDLWKSFHRPEDRSATREEIERAHTPAHFDRIAATADSPGHLDPDTHAGTRTFAAARAAAGATLAAADLVAGGEHRRAFCLVRPPGHHASAARAMGFCFFNNVAICARHLRAAHGMSRVAIVDFDVHHGNGTEDIFREDPSVFYLSLHRYPFYPGTGGPHDAGVPPVANLNIPLPGDTSPDDYLAALDRGLGEVEEFAPEAVIISAGFDAHEDDPIAGLTLSAADFGPITERIIRLAERTAAGRVISTLEGGYNLRTLGPCVQAHLAALTA